MGFGESLALSTTVAATVTPAAGAAFFASRAYARCARRTLRDDNEAVSKRLYFDDCESSRASHARASFQSRITV